MQKNNFNSSDKARVSKKKIITFTFIILIVAVAFSWLIVNYRQAKTQIAYLSTPKAQQEINQKEIDDLVLRVGRLINLPENQQPTVATIEDVEVLTQQQPFFLGAKNGDKILIFENKAIIYSPSINKLVNVGPVYGQPKEQTLADFQLEENQEEESELKTELESGLDKY